MMKKRAFILAAVLSVTALTGCGKKESPLDDPAVTAAPAEGFQTGTVSGSTYTSSFSGLKMETPSEWVYSTEKELLDMMDLAFDSIDSPESVKEIAQQATIYDAMAADRTTGNNVIIMYENLDKELKNASGVTMNDYIITFKRQLTSNAGSEYEQIGAETNIQLSGNTYRKLTYRIKDTSSNIEYIQCYYLRKIGNYINCIVSTGTDIASAATAEDYFKPL